MASLTDAAATVTTPITSANLDTVLAVVSEAAYRDDASLVSALESDGLTQLDLTGDGDGTYIAGNAAFDAWTTVINGKPTAIIAFRGTDDFDFSTNGLSAFLGSTDASYWFDTEGYYDLLSQGVAAFDAAATSLGIDQVYVTGHSLGGAAAQAYMAEHQNTDTTQYTSVVYGSLGLSGNGTWGTDARITAFADAADPTNMIGTQTAGLTVSVATADTAASATLDLASLLADPSSFLSSHSITLLADDAARYDAAVAGIPSTDVTTFFTATAAINGLTLTSSSLA